MEPEKTPPASDFLTEVADEMEATADKLDSCADGQNNGRLFGVSSATGRAGWVRFAEKFAYTASYSVSFGVCFPVFLACHYIPKNNPVVRGLIAGATDASSKVDAWLTRPITANSLLNDSMENALVAEAGAGALAPT